MIERLAYASFGKLNGTFEGMVSDAFKHFNKRKVLFTAVLVAVCTFMFTNPATANLQVVDFFSDFTSSEVTIKSNQSHQGKAVFELLHEGKAVESHEVPFKADARETVSKVVLWQNKPQYDYYTAKVSIYNDTKLHDSKSYEVSYGTVALPSFHVVDFSPSNNGVQLLLRPFNPSVADIKIELVNNNDIVYVETKEDVSLTANAAEIKITWPFLLTDNKEYTARARVLTHRLYAEPLINTYVASFTANDDVEILRDDVEVDEYGASVTLRGKSQVPFDGFIEVAARNRATNETKTYRQQLEEILVSGKEDTAGVVWNGLAPGTYDIRIEAVNQQDVALDKYETVLRIPEEAKAVETSPVKSTPGFTALTLLIAVLLTAAGIKRGG